MPAPRPAVIKELHSFLEKQLKSAVVLESEVFYLTDPGDNYGSETLKITAKIKWIKGVKSGTEEILNLVGKQPPKNELFFMVFQPQTTCIKENNIYLTIAPALEEFQRSKNVPAEDFIDIFAKCYGSRVSLDDSTDKVDLDAVLILENLYNKGFKLGDRMTGFDEETSKIVIKSLAKFHALVIAYRYQRPSDFEKKFRPYLLPHIIDVPGDLEAHMMAAVLEILKTRGRDVADETVEKIKYAFSKKMPWNSKVARQEDDRPWNTLAHRDFWVNNLMVKHDNAGNPIDIKMLDFQIYSYHTVALDVIFFLFTSTDYAYLKYKLFDFLKLYHNQFIRTCKQVDMPVEEHSYDSFLAEIRKYAPYEVMHCLFMFQPILTRKEELPETMEQMNEESFVSKKMVGEEYYNKVLEFVELFEKFGFFGPLQYYKQIDEQS